MADSSARQTDSAGTPLEPPTSGEYGVERRGGRRACHDLGYLRDSGITVGPKQLLSLFFTDHNLGKMKEMTHR